MATGGPKVGYLPTRLGSVPTAERRGIIGLAEDAGLDHVAVGDHVSFFVGAGADGLLGATGVLATSDRLGSNTGVYLLPLRHPVVVARQLADLDGLAPGRFLFGVGIGGEDRHEIAICGVDPATRGRRMDECLTIVRGLLTGEPIDFDGEFFTLEQAQILPAPSEPIPIVVGGRSGAAVERAGRLGDGWFGIWVSATRYAQAAEQMTAAAAAAGRTVGRWVNALNVWCGVGRRAQDARRHVAAGMEAFYQLPYERFERWSPFGTPQQIATFLAPYLDAGCSVFNLVVQGDDVEAEIAAAREIRDLLLDASGS
jgi:alkanesulfonate monooxygenase SsuD/methylene tetrahydromethanopterin reductase-like flavin-dependent oxidoreductase (luciferase family)